MIRFKARWVQTVDCVARRVGRLKAEAEPQLGKTNWLRREYRIYAPAKHLNKRAARISGRIIISVGQLLADCALPRLQSSGGANNLMASNQEYPLLFGRHRHRGPVRGYFRMTISAVASW